MFAFHNVTTKESFKDYIKFWKIKIVPIEDANLKSRKSWNISDKCGNEWKFIFTGNVNEWIIENDEIPFRVNMLSTGNKIEIYSAIKNRRNLKANRFLKQFINIGLLLNSCCYYGYLK